MHRPSWIEEEEVASYDGVAGGDRPMIIEPVNKKPKPVPCGLPTRRAERELGDTADRAQCFGCIYIGEAESGAIGYEDVIALMNMVRESIARTDPLTLAIFVAERYARIQEEVNSNLPHGRNPLPDWNAISVLDHIRNHNTDPELQTWMRMAELQELAQTALHSAVEIDVTTGERSLNEKQTKLYIELVKTMKMLSKSDLSSELFYSGGRHIDMNNASSGFLAVSGKPMVSYLRKLKSRKRV
jgi:hypothetical protein